MKEAYVKPVFHIERFVLNQTVAEGCGAAHGSTLGHPNHWDKTTCGWAMGNMVIWTEPKSGCTFEWGEDDEWEGVCYNNPSGGQSIFGSY